MQTQGHCCCCSVNICWLKQSTKSDPAGINNLIYHHQQPPRHDRVCRSSVPPPVCRPAAASADTLEGSVALRLKQRTSCSVSPGPFVVEKGVSLPLLFPSCCRMGPLPTKTKKKTTQNKKQTQTDISQICRSLKAAA